MNKLSIYKSTFLIFLCLSINISYSYAKNLICATFLARYYGQYSREKKTTRYIIYNNSYMYLNTINFSISHVSLLVLWNSSDRLRSYLRHRMTFFSVIAIFHGPALFSLRINLYHPTQRPDLLRGYKMRGESHYRRSSRTRKGNDSP